MRLTCARCGCTGSIEQFTADVDARRCVAIAAELGSDIGPVALRYIAYFAPAKNVLTWPRARKLLEELQQLIAVPHIRRKGRDWPVTRAMWVQALEEMLRKRADLDLPLKSHGYLLEILTGLANKTEAVAERAAEQQAQTRSRERHEELPGTESESGAMQRNRALRAASAIAAENKLRARLGQTPMSKDEELQLLKREGLM